MGFTWRPNPGPQEKFHCSSVFELFYGGSAGGGKFLSLQSPIWTNEGWKTIGTLARGDCVVAEDGSWAEFEYISEVFVGRKCYKLTFSNDEEIVADSTHLWNVIETVPFYKQHRSYSRYEKGTLTTEQLEARGVRVKMSGRHSVDGKTKRFKLPPTNGYEGIQQDLLVDPYIFGYWLGDGNAHCNYLTIGDQDLDEVIALFGARETCLERLSQKYTYKIIGLPTSYLQALGVIRPSGETRETTPETNHIPLQYFLSSRQQRLELLRGLMDSDGYCQNRGRCEIELTEKRLADDLCTLLSSLGFKYRRTVAPSSFNMTFTPRVSVFNIKRKGQNQKQTLSSEHDVAVWIESIEETESVPVQCIRIKHPSHTFLVGKTMIPTHNSESGLIESLRYVHVPGYTAILFRRTFKELSQPKGLIERSREVFPEYGAKYNEQKYQWRFPSGATITFSHMEHLSDREQHKSAEYAYLFFDELTTFEEDQYLYLFSRCRTTATDPFTGKVIPARIRSGSNPGDVGHEWVKNRWRAWLDEDYPNPAKTGEIRYYKRIDDIDTEVPQGTPEALSRQCIRSSLYDNPVLMERDPEYENRLKALPLEDRLRLLEGRWDVLLKGNVFKPEWFKIIHYAPEGLKWVRYWDLAMSVRKKADFSASPGVAMDKEANLYIRDMINEKMEWPDFKKVMVATMLEEQHISEHGVEKAAHGLAAFQELMRMPELAGIRILSIDVDTDKLARAHIWSPRAEQGKVFLVNGAWVSKFLLQAALFDGTGKTHDDEIDGISGGVKMIAGRPWRKLKFLHL